MLKVAGWSEDIWNHSQQRKEHIKKLCIKHKLTLTLESHVAAENPLETSRRLYQLNFETEGRTRQISITSFHKGGLILEDFYRMDIQCAEGCKFPVWPTTFDTREGKPESKYVPIERFVSNECKYETFTGASSRSHTTQQNRPFKNKEYSENACSIFDNLYVSTPVFNLELESADLQAKQNESYDSQLSSDISPPTLNKVLSLSRNDFHHLHCENNSRNLEEILGEALKGILYETIEDIQGLDGITPTVSPTTVDEKDDASKSKYFASPEISPTATKIVSSRYKNAFKPLSCENNSRDLEEILGEALKGILFENIEEDVN